MIRICFVCLGNICRSPTAEAVMRHVVDREGVANKFDIDSAGTGGWHVGEPPDERSAQTARERGFTLEGAARQVKAADFNRYDYLIAMDRSNHQNLLRMAKNDDARAKVFLFRSFDPASKANAEVPDPYYGGPDGFDNVFDICEAAARGFLDHLRGKHGL